MGGQIMRTMRFLGAAVVLGAFVSGQAQAQGFTLTSPAFTEGGTIKAEQVFNKDGCKGGNISPALSWRGAPAGTKSFVLTLFDPDAPTGSGFWHWVVFNIPPGTNSLAKNAGDPKANLAPNGAVQIRNDYSLMGYGGPCPPPGDEPHHYVFTLSAVDQMLPLDAGASAAVVGFMLHFHTLAKSQLTGRYGD
jgi:hypothetical protein